jgi:hypothetical protein
MTATATAAAATVPATAASRIETLCTQFKLPTVKAELVQRLHDAGHGDALETVAEVLELEAADRQERRVDRLRRTSELPPGKTFASSTTPTCSSAAPGAGEPSYEATTCAPRPPRGKRPRPAPRSTGRI